MILASHLLTLLPKTLFRLMPIGMVSTSPAAISFSSHRRLTDRYSAVSLIVWSLGGMNSLGLAILFNSQ